MTVEEADELRREVARLREMVHVLGGGQLDAGQQARDGIRARERERCAKLVDEFHWREKAAREIATAIRELK